MTRNNITKSNLLLRLAPRGAVLSSRWLRSHDISSKLAWWYTQSGLLERLSDSAYKLAGDHVGWEGVLYALQQQYDFKIHAGGKTALQLLGKSHYLATNFTKQPVQLFSTQGVRLPKWISAECFKEKFTLYTSNLFSHIDEEPYGLVTKIFNQLSIQLSSPERAALEACYLVGRVVSFEEIALLVEGLSRLRPQVVQDLLERCQSIKVKRLFLYFSEYYQHPWANDLNIEKLDLGKGKHTIAEGGVFNAKYKISTPRLKEE